ncbi:MAG: hypothetical protein WAQ13_00030, partial [Bacilli bacterium]
ETLRGYLAGEEFPAIGAVIHKIQGVSLNIGSRKLYRFCGFLEERIAKKPNAEDFDIFIRFHRRIIEHCKEQGEKCLQTQKI